MHAKFDELRLSGQLPSPSSAGLRILELTKDDDYDHDELVRTILADPALSGRLIKIANNGSQDGLPNVTTVAQATMRLGHRAVRSIALGFTMVADHRRGRSEAFDYDGYWSEALATAVAAHVLGQVTRGVEPSVAFTCALLADVGKLAFASIHPERYSEILQEHPPSPTSSSRGSSRGSSVSTTSRSRPRSWRAGASRVSSRRSPCSGRRSPSRRTPRSATIRS
ncbi:MAG: HDOD domain-containing protein [Planctomycetota bacterium]